MYGAITENELKSFLNLKKPTQAVGYFSDDFSKEVHKFLATLESRSKYTGTMAILPNEEAEKVFDSLLNLVKSLLVQDHGYSEEPEIFIALWQLNYNESLIMALDVFGSPYVSKILYTDAKTVNKVSFKNSDLHNIKRGSFGENFKNALLQINKE